MSLSKFEPTVELHQTWPLKDALPTELQRRGWVTPNLEKCLFITTSKVLHLVDPPGSSDGPPLQGLQVDVGHDVVLQELRVRVQEGGDLMRLLRVHRIGT